MSPVLLESIEPVLRDLARAGLDAPRLDGVDWMGDPGYASTMMWSSDGSGSGLSVRLAAALTERIVEAADQVQEWAIEDQLWRSARTNWPRCPAHPENHPLRASVHGSHAMWVCPVDQSGVTPIGGR